MFVETSLHQRLWFSHNGEKKKSSDKCSEYFLNMYFELYENYFVFLMHKHYSINVLFR